MSLQIGEEKRVPEHIVAQSKRISQFPIIINIFQRWVDGALKKETPRRRLVSLFEPISSNDSSSTYTTVALCVWNHQHSTNNGLIGAGRRNQTVNNGSRHLRLYSSTSSFFFSVYPSRTMSNTTIKKSASEKNEDNTRCHTSAVHCDFFPRRAYLDALDVRPCIVVYIYIYNLEPERESYRLVLLLNGLLHCQKSSACAP